MKINGIFSLVLVTFFCCCVQSEPLRKVHRQRPAKRFDIDPNPRDKREGFGGFRGIPHAMRGLAQDIGKGFSSVVSQGNSIGQRMIQSFSHSTPTAPVIMYGNWKPIFPTDPHYLKPTQPYKPVQSSYAPANDYNPPQSTYQEPEYQNSIDTYQPELPSYKPEPVVSYQPAPISTSYSPAPVVTSYNPEPIVSTYHPPEPVVSSSYQPIEHVVTSSYQTAEPVITSSYQPVEPIVSSYQPAEPIISSYQPVEPIVSSYQPAEPISSYQPVEPVITSYQPAPIQSSYEPVEESYGSPLSQPESVSSPVIPSVPSVPFVDSGSDDISPPVRLSSPELSPLPANQEEFVEQVLQNNLFRDDAEKFKSRPVRFS